jgi:hypothetical protein
MIFSHQAPNRPTQNHQASSKGLPGLPNHTHQPNPYFFASSKPDEALENAKRQQPTRLSMTPKSIIRYSNKGTEVLVVGEARWWLGELQREVFKF